MDTAVLLSDDGEVEIDLTKGFGRFPKRPTDSQIAAIKVFVQETGHPEDHPDLCLAEPDLDREHFIVSHLDVPLQRRRTEHPAWCAICQIWKFGDGRLIWCPDDRALRPVGHDCADTHFEGRWSEMEREYKRREAARDAQDYLLDTLPTLERRANELAGHMSTARQLEAAHDALFKKASLLAEHLYAAGKRGGSMTVQRKASRGGPTGIRSSTGTSDFYDDEIGRLRGLSFLTKSFRPTSKLLKAETDLRLLKSDSPDLALNRVADMSEEEAVDSARMVQGLLRKADKAVKHVEESAAFLTLENFETVRRWATDIASPYLPEVTITENGLRTRRAGEMPVTVPFVRATMN